MNVTKAAWNRDRTIYDYIEPPPKDRPVPIPFHPGGEEDTELPHIFTKVLQKWHPVNRQKICQQRYPCFALPHKTPFCNDRSQYGGSSLGTFRRRVQVSFVPA